MNITWSFVKRGMHLFSSGCNSHGKEKVKHLCDEANDLRLDVRSAGLIR